MISADGTGHLGFIDTGLAARERAHRRGWRMALLVSVSVTLVWLVYVIAAGAWGRVGRNWESAATMVFGSFVAGSTPQGSGAVAFPVFTKGLDVSSEVARTFSLCIQTVGMGTAALAIFLTRRQISWRSLFRALPWALIGFAVALLLLSDPSRPFTPSHVPSSYVKVGFTLIVASMALITYLGSRVPVRLVQREAPPMNRRLWGVIIVTSLLGGLATGLTGSGADVFLTLGVVVLMAVDTKVGIPTSVVFMAILSVVGFVALGVVGGQLDVTVSGETVVALGGEPVVDGAEPGLAPQFGDEGDPLPARQTDLFGLWLAAVPVAAWAGPLGSAVAARMSTRKLIVFVCSLAGLETLSTIVFLEELRTDPSLISFAVVGLLVLGAGLWWLTSHRLEVLGLPRLEHSRAVSRADIALSPHYRRALEPDRSDQTEENEEE